MEIKKEYNVGDSAWIHGIHRDNKLVKGEVIKKFTIDRADWPNEFYYVVAIPSHIEYLLEIRQWENMSQDAKGPIGMYRTLGRQKEVIDKFIRKTGYNFADDSEEFLEEPTDEQIHAAIEKAQKVSTHAPLVIKPERPKRKFYNRKKKS